MLATVISKIEFIVMKAMNKYVVWISPYEADRFDADLIISLLDEILFFLNGKQVKSYQRKPFEKYNPKWVTVENPE